MRGFARSLSHALSVVALLSLAGSGARAQEAADPDDTMAEAASVVDADAEGRMILADALSYGIATYSPKAVIDLATLTGAAIIALGSNVAALVGTSKQLTDRLRKHSEKTGEKMWELPLYEEFHEQIKSTFADIRNIGGRPGGAN